MAVTTVDERISALEARTAVLELHAGLCPPDPPPAARPRVPARPASQPQRSAPREPAPRRPVSLEDALGGRVLAWVGGLAVALGLCLMLAIAVTNGWLGEIDRTLLAGLGSLAFLAAGVWAQERRGRTDAAKAAAATGIVGLFATAVVAGSVYALVPELLATAAAIVVGALATGIAIRWSAPGIGALGHVGALLVPALVGATLTGGGVVMLLVAFAASVGVLLWRRWSWLAFATFAVATPQWVAYLVVETPAAPVALALLVAAGALGAAAAAGFEVRTGADRLRIGSVVLLAVNALVLGVAGAWVLEHDALWLAALAVAHLGTGFAARGRIPRELSSVLLAIGVVIADVAAAQVLDGLPLVATWAATSALFAVLVRLSSGTEERLAFAGLGAHLTLALGHALAEAPPDQLAGGPDGIAGLVALATAAIACLVSGRIAGDGRPQLAAALDAVAIAVLGYQTAIALDGLALTVALAAESAALAFVARRLAATVPVALAGSLAFAAAALVHALAVFAGPVALVDGLAADPLAAAAALGAAIAAIAVVGWTVPSARRAAFALAATVALYAASVQVVTAFPGEQGQLVLSALWAVAGVAALVAGLVRDTARLRHAALVLLGVTAAKVFVYDLASLTSLHRVGSLLALGVLLLGAAYAWQRIRPPAAPDLRTLPSSLR